MSDLEPLDGLPEFAFEWGVEDRFLFAMSGLSWAVGHLEGLGMKDSYAQKVHARLVAPLRYVQPLKDLPS